MVNISNRVTHFSVQTLILNSRKSQYYEKEKRRNIFKKSSKSHLVYLDSTMGFPVVMYGCESWTVKKAEHRRIDAFELWCWRRLLRVPGLQGDPTSPFWRRSALGFLWKEWCSNWNSSTLATSCEELSHWKRLWCWEGLGAGREGGDRGWDGWMASLTRWTWVWVNSGSWWWTGRPGVLHFIGSQRIGHDWATEVNWTDASFWITLRIGRKINSS